MDAHTQSKFVASFGLTLEVWSTLMLDFKRRPAARLIEALRELKNDDLLGIQDAVSPILAIRQLPGP